MSVGSHPDLDGLLDLAVRRGRLTLVQADDLRALEAERQGQAPAAPANFTADPEPLRFVGGLNDVFVALGTALVISGLLRFELLSSLWGAAGFMVVVWAMAEVLTGRLRRSLPSMLCATAFAWGGATLASFATVGAGLSMFTFTAVFWPAVGWLVACGVFYLRFRLPFGMFLTGVGVVVLALWQFSLSTGTPNPRAAIAMLLTLGMVFLAAALAFDLRDRLRLTVVADSAFWLHVLAAPLIVHSLVWLSALTIAGTGPDFMALLEALPNIAGPLIATVAAVFTGAALIALVLDRRAMLVSTLVYMSASIIYLLSQGEGSTALAATPVIIGGGVVLLGTAWKPLRRLVFRVLPLGSLEPRLSPLT